MDLSADNDLYQSLSTLIRQLVSNPDLIRVEAEQSENALKFAVHAHPNDMKRLIGKAGLTSRSIRTVLSAIGLTRGKAITLEIYELPEFPSTVPDAKKRR